MHSSEGTSELHDDLGNRGTDSGNVFNGDARHHRGGFPKSTVVLVPEADPRPAFGAAALAAFVILCVTCWWLIVRFGAFDPELKLYELALLGLACVRLIHLVTYDKILDPVRERLESGTPNGLVQLLAQFVACIWCTGMWAAVIVVTLFSLGLWGRFVVSIFAVAALGSLLQVVSRAIAGCTIEPNR